MIPLITWLLALLTTFSNFTGKVVAVLDGDTIEVLTEDKQTVRIRLSNIDCPEKSQAYGMKAKQYTASLCFSKTVKVVSFGEDRYGRTLANVVLEDGKILNEELLKHGFAWHYKRYSTDSKLADFETKAKTAKLGLWADPNPIAPWEFRKLDK